MCKIEVLLLLLSVILIVRAETFLFAISLQALMADDNLLNLVMLCSQVLPELPEHLALQLPEPVTFKEAGLELKHER
jgi:hypothetical protein